MSSINEICSSFNLSKEETKEVSSMLVELNMNPDDPEAIRVVIDVMLKHKINDIKSTLESTLRRSENMIDKQRETACKSIDKRISEQHAKIALEMQNKLSESISKTIIKREDNKSTTNGILIAVLLIVSFVVGLYVHSIYPMMIPTIQVGKFTDDEIHSYLLGFITFILLRFVISIFCKMKIVRYILCLPQQKDENYG